MRLIASLMRAVLPAALLTGGIVTLTAAGQRTGTLAVSVRVVDSCRSTTNAAGGLTGQACAGSTSPVAVLREIAPAASVATTTEPMIATPIARTTDASGLVTIIY